MQIQKVLLVKKEKINAEIIKFSIKSKELAKEAKPGQFLEIRITDGFEPFLRRPISIFNIDEKNDIIEFIFQIRGEGTKILGKKVEGDLIDVLGPLGKGYFQYENYKNIAIIGGGIGIFPLFELAKEAKICSKNVNIYLGFRSKENVILEENFRKVSTNLTMATDDGSYGKNGFAISYLEKDLEDNKVDCIYACGPMPMIKAVKQLGSKMNIPAQISLEELMGCGIGACLGCAVQENIENETKYKYVCKDGPVFFADTVKI